MAGGPGRAPAPALRRLRIVLAKVGLDGHDRGVKVVARALRDAGHEVIYTGLRQTPEMVVDAALQEDAEVIGLSMHSGAHMTLVPRVLDVLRERQAEDVVVFAGGIIPDDDAAELKKLGVAEIFPPGTPLQGIVDWLAARFPAGAEG
ncbi:MAG: cobalamin B12-binding domain-containing protein [Candidatus Dormibacterales bacterium]